MLDHSQDVNGLVDILATLEAYTVLDSKGLQTKIPARHLAYTIKL